MTIGSWSHIGKYLETFSNYYPAIGAWFGKLQKQFPTGRRSIVAFVGTHGDIAGLAITKNGPQSKLCHISIADHARSDGRGAELMRAAVDEMILAGSRHVRVTTGEEVAADYGEFFSRCGFAVHGVRKNRYRRGADELEWAAPADLMVSRLCKNAIESPLFGSSSVRLLRLQSIGAECQWTPVGPSLHRRFAWRSVT